MLRASQLASAGVAAHYAAGLAGIGELAAQQSGVDDYKALVCVFLYGGNDHGNTLVPYDQTNYLKYSQIRGGSGEAGGGVALARDTLEATRLLAPTDQTLTDDVQYSLSPSMPMLKARFDQGKLAPLLNVGPLEAPLKKSEFLSDNHAAYPRPQRLFSHNDQQSIWQTHKTEGETAGWGGKLADLTMQANSNAMFTAINAIGSGAFVQGEKSTPFHISKSGANEFKAIRYGQLYGSPQCASALETLLGQATNNPLQADYAATCARANAYGSFVNQQLTQTGLATRFPENNSLAGQLAVVARLVANRRGLGLKRQVFFVGMGGFDNHSGLVGHHQLLLQKLDAALDAFFNATVELGVSERVTTFTASDFGRTLSNNGDGSDHGWGGHHFVLGGSVNGGKFYGTAPKVSTKSDDQVGQGRLLPSTSIDEYSTTLARWFGIPASELSSIAPNIGRFNNPNLGFLSD